MKAAMKAAPDEPVGNKGGEPIEYARPATPAPAPPPVDPAEVESIRWFVYVAVGLSVVAAVVGLAAVGYVIYVLLRSAFGA